MSRPYRIGPGMACMVTGFTNAWAKHDNGRLVIVLREHPEHAGMWVIRPRAGEGPLHTRGADGGNKLSSGAGVQAKFLMPICPAREIHVMQGQRGE